MIFVVKKPLGFIANIFEVLIGKISWVGLKYKDNTLNKNVKKGVLNPSSHLSNTVLDEQTSRRLDMIYAKDYETTTDINIITRALASLGVRG
jgi:hypothetical protein